MHTIRNALGTLLLLAAALSAQWTNQRPSAFSTVGAAATVGYDPISGEAYLIRMPSTGSPLTLWRFDDGVWTPLTQPAAQPPTAGATCSWPGHGMLVHGAGTWVWNGTTWTQVPTTTTPPAFQGMAWDPVRSAVVGLTGTLQTFEFDGVDWQQRSVAWPSGGPSVQQARLAWDPVGSVMVAIAGDYQGCVRYLWNGTAWSMPVLWPPASYPGFSVCSVPGRGVFLTGGAQFPMGWGPTGLWSSAQFQPVGGSGELPGALASSLSWYDAARGRLVVTSGFNSTPSNSLPTGFGVWYFDGATWSRPAVGNGPRFVNVASYDSWRGRLLQFGGTLYFGYEHPELWARDRQGLWSSLGVGPQGRSRQACAFDSWRGRLVVFGGRHFDAGGGSEYVVDAYRTHEWDGSNWNAIPFAGPFGSPNFPVGRIDAAMAFDRARGRCVLFGGYFGQGSGSPYVYRNDTFEWDGTNWTRALPTTVPPAVAPTMWFDPTLGMCVLSANGRWAWSGADWQALPTPPMPGSGVLTFDASREVTVASTSTGVHELRNGAWQQVSTQAFGASGAFDLGRGTFVTADDVYWYEAGDAAAATLAPFGAGCPGSAGTPVLHGEEPFRLGTTRTVHLASAPVGAPFFGMLGGDVGSYLGHPLPIDLGAAGMPQCALHTEIAAYELRGGTDWTIGVPGTAPLLGLVFRLQAFVFDTPANALGATTSNGLRLRIGS